MGGTSPRIEAPSPRHRRGRHDRRHPGCSEQRAARRHPGAATGQTSVFSWTPATGANSTSRRGTRTKNRRSPWESGGRMENEVMMCHCAFSRAAREPREPRCGPKATQPPRSPPRRACRSGPHPNVAPHRRRPRRRRRPTQSGRPVPRRTARRRRRRAGPNGRSDRVEPIVIRWVRVRRRGDTGAQRIRAARRSV